MSSVSRSRSALLGTISSQAYMVITMLVSIVSTPLMVKYLDKDSYGLSILFFQIIGYLALFDFGFGTAVIQQLAIHGEETENNQVIVNRIVSTGTIIFSGLGLILAVMGFFFAPFVPGIYGLRPDLANVAVPIVFSLSLVMGVQFLQRGLGSVFYAYHRQALIGTAYFIVNISSTIITVVLLSNGIGLWSFVYANVFHVVTFLLVQIILLRRYYPHIRISIKHFDKKLLESMFKYGKFIFLNGLATQIILNTDRLVIGKVVSLAAIAVFSITVRIPEVGLFLISRVTENATPAVMEIVNRESNSQIREQYRRLLLLTTALGVLAFWLILTFNSWFISLWVGLDFFAGNLVLGLALVLMIQQSLVRSMAFFLYAKGNSRQLSFMSVFEAGLNIALSIFLGRYIGLVGIIAGTLIASLLTSSWYTPYLLWRYMAIPLRDSWRSILMPLVGISLAGASTFVLVNWIRQLLPQTIILFAITASLSGVLLVAFTWVAFLRLKFKDYVPDNLKRFLLVHSTTT